MKAHTPGQIAEHPAVASLRHDQRQLDADGCMVGVSRQALDETLAIYDELLAALQECEAAEDATHDQQADAFRNARAAISKASTP